MAQQVVGSGARLRGAVAGLPANPETMGSPYLPDARLDELRRIAGHHMQGEQGGRTIQTTALVHEAYLKLIDVDNVNWEHRAHFYAVSSQIMRRILRKIAANEHDQLGDTSTLADPAVVDDLVHNRQNKKAKAAP